MSARAKAQALLPRALQRRKRPRGIRAADVAAPLPLAPLHAPLKGQLATKRLVVYSSRYEIVSHEHVSALVTDARESGCRPNVVKALLWHPGIKAWRDALPTADMPAVDDATAVAHPALAMDGLVQAHRRIRPKVKQTRLAPMPDVEDQLSAKLATPASPPPESESKPDDHRRSRTGSARARLVQLAVSLAFVGTQLVPFAQSLANFHVLPESIQPLPFVIAPILLPGDRMAVIAPVAEPSVLAVDGHSSRKLLQLPPSATLVSICKRDGTGCVASTVAAMGFALPVMAVVAPRSGRIYIALVSSAGELKIGRCSLVVDNCMVLPLRESTNLMQAQAYDLSISPDEDYLIVTMAVAEAAGSRTRYRLVLASIATAASPSASQPLVSNHAVAETRTTAIIDSSSLVVIADGLDATVVVFDSGALVAYPCSLPTEEQVGGCRAQSILAPAISSGPTYQSIAVAVDDTNSRRLFAVGASRQYAHGSGTRAAASPVRSDQTKLVSCAMDLTGCIDVELPIAETGKAVAVSGLIVDPVRRAAVIMQQVIAGAVGKMQVTTCRLEGTKSCAVEQLADGLLNAAMVYDPAARTGIVYATAGLAQGVAAYSPPANEELCAEVMIATGCAAGECLPVCASGTSAANAVVADTAIDLSAMSGEVAMTIKLALGRRASLRLGPLIRVRFEALELFDSATEPSTIQVEWNPGQTEPSISAPYVAAGGRVVVRVPTGVVITRGESMVLLRYLSIDGAFSDDAVEVEPQYSARSASSASHASVSASRFQLGALTPRSRAAAVPMLSMSSDSETATDPVPPVMIDGATLAAKVIQSRNPAFGGAASTSHSSDSDTLDTAESSFAPSIEYSSY
ncbi:uncharacterized protein AMSG_11870 [Thecamonas trahens ATCC 50062]|uniref:Uncharacterized protein n=1 Tax=Thecamonas trahens ATCC 50062 TaxID=461836 RepID=A0A0L0DAC8_THETB|nr:hypothetical protein AMSG_11870 [Thecamonas trahens ATCC 50062]KNC49297.1 hypothetical protein AMSG_11870 [Thecamonas trahens ATCC 50062]|eukprot:XP_013758068.1 hypothetical protein AMSG_11870 [Thecamonas trahens ATCC 50062]